MELNFDKEIDAILRKARESETAFAASNPQSHLDADEISAFAENALPEKAKIRYTEHLADCDKCRKILSNLILLDSETESEIVHAGENIVSAPAIPWYRKLFVFPNLAYSLGALVLVFGGLIAFTVLQSLNLSENSTISQVSNKTLDTKSAPAQANMSLSPQSPSNTMTANMASNSNTSFEADKPSAANTMPKSAMRSKKDSEFSGGIPTDDEAPGFQDSNLSKEQPTPTTDVITTEEDKPANAEKKNVDNSKLKTETRSNPPPSVFGDTTKQTPKAVKKRDSDEGRTTSVGGKIFRREGSAWVDSAYQSGSNMMLPSLTRISRGSNEYKNLDADLRKIADKLGGIVIVVWKSKAYRIQ